MKLPVIIFAILALAMGSLTLIVLTGSDDTPTEAVSNDDLAQFSHKKREAYMKSILKDPLVIMDEKVRTLKWAFLNNEAYLDSYIRENATAIRAMPQCLASVALELVKEDKLDNAATVLKLATELYPNDPDVLGIVGISAYLSGRTQEARAYLEQAESWRQDTPLVEFYLGAILVNSGNSADRTRGKTLFLRVVNRLDPELSELAALTLLTTPNVPLIDADYQSIFNALDELDALRVDNPNLNADVMRILTNQALRFSPQHALDLALLLFQFPNVQDSDRLVTISLAQSQGEIETAAEIISSLNQANDIPNESKERLMFDRLSAVQMMLEENIDEGFEAFKSLVDSQPDEDALHTAFQIVFRDAALPLEIERELLELYLEIPIRKMDLTFATLNRLMEVNPLQEEQWINYVVERLLPAEPALASIWLAKKNQSSAIVESLSAKDSDLNQGEATALTEAYLATENPEAALLVLQEKGETIPQPLKEFLFARIALAQGKTELALERWQAAQNGALTSNAFPLMKNLGFLALDMDQPVTALNSLYSSFNAGVEFSPSQLGRLMNLTLEHGTLNQTIKIAESLEKMFPDEPVHKNNLAYFYFLAQENLESAIETMRTLVEDYPDVTQYRLTLTLGLLKVGRNNEAKRLLESTSVNWEEAGTRGKMIYAAVLAANNQRVVADGLIQNINLDDLIPEEKALLETN